MHQKTKAECGCLPHQLFLCLKNTDKKKLLVMCVIRNMIQVDKTPWHPSESLGLCSDHFVHVRPSDSKHFAY